MKVIDVLNKIAHCEEVPDKIRYGGYIWKYSGDFDYHSGDANEYYDDKFLCTGIDDVNEFLNTEVEIIEEDNKIEKLNEDELYLTEFQQKIIVRKINEIIDSRMKEIEKLKVNTNGNDNS